MPIYTDIRTNREVGVPRPRFRLEDPPLDVALCSETLIKLKVLRQDEPIAALSIEKWCENRKKTLALIPTIRDSVVTICNRCNAGREAGAAASIAGFVSAVVGVILKWKGFPIGDDFLNGGKYLTATGTAVLVTSNIAEACLTLSPTNRIKEIIEADIELTQRIRKWVEFSHDVENCFDKLLQCNIASPGFLKIVQFLDNCMSLIDAGSYEIGNLIEDLAFSKVKGIEDITSEECKKVIKCLVRIRNNPKITKPFKEMCKIASETPSLVSFVQLGINVYYGILIQVRVLYGILPSLPFGFKSSNAVYCVLDVIKILYDLVLNLKFQEIEKRQTAYFAALEKVTLALESELNKVNKYAQHKIRCNNLVQGLSILKIRD